MTSFKCASFALREKSNETWKGWDYIFFYNGPSVFVPRRQCFFPLPPRLTLQAAAAVARAEEASAPEVRRAKCWWPRRFLPQPSSRQQRGDTSVPSLRGEYPAPPIGGWSLTAVPPPCDWCKDLQRASGEEGGVLVFGHNKCCFNSKRANNMYCGVYVCVCGGGNRNYWGRPSWGGNTKAFSRKFAPLKIMYGPFKCTAAFRGEEGLKIFFYAAICHSWLGGTLLSCQPKKNKN